MINLKEVANSILAERFVNALTPNDMQPHAGEVWDILQKSYQTIGGFKTASNVKELIKKSFMWKMVRREGKIVAVRIYKDKNGRKSIAAGTDGSRAGKHGLYSIIQADLNLNRSWSEVSGAMEHILIKNGATPIPIDLVPLFLNGKEILKRNADGYHYTRNIGGIPYEKIILVGLDIRKYIK